MSFRPHRDFVNFSFPTINYVAAIVCGAFLPSCLNSCTALGDGWLLSRHGDATESAPNENPMLATGSVDCGETDL
jgi:hypothetical protein